MDDSLEQPSPLRNVPSITTGDTADQPLDFPHLIRVCEAATKGEWQSSGNRVEPINAPRYEQNDGWIICDCQGPDGVTNAAFMAQCNPTIILSLIRRLQAAEKTVKGCAVHDTKELASGTVKRFTGLDEIVNCDLKAHPSRGEADTITGIALTQRIAQLEAEVKTDDQIINERNKLLALFTCQAHGSGCVPHAIAEVTSIRQRLAKMEELLRTAIRIFESKEMVSVCMVSQIHHAPYSGEIFPTEQAKQALEGKK